MVTRKRHIREFIETLFGPIVFILYFVGAYFLTALGCMLIDAPADSSLVNTTTLGVLLLVMTTAALAMLGLITRDAAGRLVQSTSDKDAEDTFLSYVTVVLALLSFVAVLWVGATIAMLPLCSASI